MTPDELGRQGWQLLAKHFELPENTGDEQVSVVMKDGTNPREYLVQLLTPSIKQMLDQSFDRLLNVLYRIDLPEKKVVEILEESPPDEVANRLSQAIVDRQLEKISLRERYREPGD